MFDKAVSLVYAVRAMTATYLLKHCKIVVNTLCLGFSSSQDGFLATPSLSGSNMAMSMDSPTSILDTNLEGISGSPASIVTDVSVMVVEESGMTSSPSSLIC